MKNADLCRFLVKGVCDRARRVLKNLKAVSRAPDQSNTHALSTSMRRLLTARSIVRSLYAQKLIPGKYLFEFKSLRSAIGDLRDAQEIRIKFMAESPPSLFAEAFSDMLEVQEAEAMEQIAAAVSGFDGSGIKDLAKKSKVKKICGREPVISPQRILKELFEQMQDLRQAAVENKDDSALHQLRVSFKHYRYAIEMLAPDIVPAKNSDLKFLHGVQEYLGEAHDWMVLEEKTRNFAAENRKLTGQRACLQHIRKLRVQSHLHARQNVQADWDEIAKFVNIG